MDREKLFWLLAALILGIVLVLFFNHYNKVKECESRGYVYARTMFSTTWKCMEVKK